MAFDTTPAAKTEGSIKFLATSSPIAALLMSSWTGKYSKSSGDISPVTLVVEYMCSMGNLLGAQSILVMQRNKF